MSLPRVLLIADEPFEARLREAVPELNGNLNRWPGDASELYVQNKIGDLVATSPDIVAFGPGLPVGSVLDLAADLDRARPGVEILVVAEPSARLWERAARAGVREVVAPSAGDDELAGALRRTMATVDARRGGAPQAPAEPDQPAVVVVRSPKGGSGKTMVATNLAVSLARTHPGEVVLLDLDLQFGDMASALGIEPTYTIADATANVELTPTSLKALLATHRSNLYTLCAPVRPEEADEITRSDLTAVIALLRSAFRFVIIDTAAGTDPRVLAALDEATDLVLVCSMDVSSVRALRKELESMGTREGQPRRHVVLNRADSRVALDVRDIEATIGASIDVHVSSSRLVPLHMNCGVPVVEAEPASPVAKQLLQLVSRLSPAPAKAKRGLRRRA